MTSILSTFPKNSTNTFLFKDKKYDLLLLKEKSLLFRFPVFIKLYLLIKQSFILLFKVLLFYLKKKFFLLLVMLLMLLVFLFFLKQEIYFMFIIVKRRQ